MAEAEAQPVLDGGRASLARLLGVPAGGLAFTESASAARQALRPAWPLHAGDTVAVAPSEWGPNLSAVENRGLRIIELAAHGDGTIDLGQLERILAGPPLAFVHLTQVASHRALFQPVTQAAELCHAAGVPLWVDAAQALGHVDTACGADAQYATSRKWLAGPRGVGMPAVAERWWDKLQVHASPLARSSLPDDASPIPAAGIRGGQHRRAGRPVHRSAAAPGNRPGPGVAAPGRGRGTHPSGAQRPARMVGH